MVGGTPLFLSSGPSPVSWELEGSPQDLNCSQNSDVVPGICWSHSPSLGVIALSAPITTGTTAAFTSSFSP